MVKIIASANTAKGMIHAMRLKPVVGGRGQYGVAVLLHKALQDQRVAVAALRPAVSSLRMRSE